MSDWNKFPDREQLNAALAAHLECRLREDIGRNGCASLAVSGGSTPKGLFAQLSQYQLDWSKVWITLVDERWVEPDSPDSNEHLVREWLLQGPAAQANFLGLKTAHADAQEGLPEVAARLHRVPQPFSAVVLGMGGDGHTASWFPEADNLQRLLDPQGATSLGATHPVTAPHQRITLTLSAVLSSCDIAVHITGEDKCAVIQQASAKRYPIAAILEQITTPTTIWWAP